MSEVNIAALQKQKVAEAKLKRLVNKRAPIHLVITNHGDLTKLKETLKGAGAIAVQVHDHSPKAAKPETPKAPKAPKPKAEGDQKPEGEPKA